jgi:multiple sugar transport system ATP-binding protein
MNLLPGMARNLPGDTIEVRISEDARAILPGRLRGGESPRQVTLGIRPQDIQLQPPDAEGGLIATVFAYEPLQEVGRLTLTFTGVEQRIVVETLSDPRVQTGEAVGLHFVPGRTHLFDNETGERLTWEIAQVATA